MSCNANARHFPAEIGKDAAAAAVVKVAVLLFGQVPACAPLESFEAVAGAACGKSSQRLVGVISAALASPRCGVLTALSVCRNEDLKEMLESSKESLKLEAMKRIVGVSASWEFNSQLLRSSVGDVSGGA